MHAAPLHGRIGVEVAGINAAADPPVGALRDLVIRSGLVVIRRQALDDDELVAFSRAIGDGRLVEPARTVSHAPGTRLVSYLTNLRHPTGEPLGVGDDETDFWHSDQEFRSDPATLSTLYCMISPVDGGATSFASTSAEHLRLGEETLETLREVWAEREPAASHDNVDHRKVQHPAVLVCPRSGREFVYVSENVLGFRPLGPEHSSRLKDTVLDAVLAPDNIYQHRWQVGDLLVYDNAQLLHRRERFTGLRWLKGTKIHAPAGLFASPVGTSLSLQPSS